MGRVLPFPELGTRKGGSPSKLQVTFPQAPGSCNAVCKQAPLKKNVNEGAIHYLQLAPCHPLLLWAMPSCRNRGSIWWEQGNPGGTEPLRSSFFPSAKEAQLSISGPQNSWAFHFLPNKAKEFFGFHVYTKGIYLQPNLKKQNCRSFLIHSQHSLPHAWVQGKRGKDDQSI